MESLAEKITQFVQKNEEKYRRLSQEIWGYAELAFQEEKSVRALTEMLEQEGFRITAGLAGIPTAFVAEYGAGKPVIGILGEYDALPSLSQKAGGTGPQRRGSWLRTQSAGCGRGRRRSGGEGLYEGNRP